MVGHCWERKAQVIPSATHIPSALLLLFSIYQTPYKYSPSLPSFLLPSLTHSFTHSQQLLLFSPPPCLLLLLHHHHHPHVLQPPPPPPPPLCTWIVLRTARCRRKKGHQGALPPPLPLSSRIQPLRGSVLLQESVQGWSKNKGLVSTSWDAAS